MRQIRFSDLFGRMARLHQRSYMSQLLYRAHTLAYQKGYFAAQCEDYYQIEGELLFLLNYPVLPASPQRVSVTGYTFLVKHEWLCSLGFSTYYTLSSLADKLFYNRTKLMREAISILFITKQL